MKKRWKTGFLTFILCMAGMMIMTSCSQMTKGKQTDLDEFYELVSEKEYVVLFEGENLAKAFEKDGQVYLPYDFVHDYMNGRFYYDEDYQRILYAQEDELEMFQVEEEKDVTRIEGEIYLSVSLVKERSEVGCEVYQKPNRIAVTKAFGTQKICRPKKDTVIRRYNKDGAEYMAEVSEGESLLIKEKKDSQYYRVVKQDGITGYIKIEETGGEEEEERVCETKLPEYSHLTMDETVCMAWHQMESKAGNASLDELTKDAEGILNVVSPTWFKLADATGEITSHAQSSYVEEAHRKGMQVWALADDFSYGEDGIYYVANVLAHYDNRQKLIQNLVNEVINSGADGLNIDYEKIYEEIADDYLEFIRELSIACRKNQIILSVDTYVEQPYNLFFDREELGAMADYLIVMGYDEHWAGDEEAGSVASMPYVKQGIDSAVAKVDKERVINGIPFFTRVWTENVDGVATDSQAVSMSVGEKELANQGVTPVWLEDLGQYYGEYPIAEGCIRVWLEEEQSVRTKLDYMKESGIGGVACWKLGLEKSSIWREIAQYME